MCKMTASGTSRNWQICQSRFRWVICVQGVIKLWKYDLVVLNHQIAFKNNYIDEEIFSCVVSTSTLIRPGLCHFTNKMVPYHIYNSVCNYYYFVRSTLGRQIQQQQHGGDWNVIGWSLKACIIPRSPPK